MAADNHKTNLYVGLAGEGALIVGDGKPARRSWRNVPSYGRR